MLILFEKKKKERKTFSTSVLPVKQTHMREVAHIVSGYIFGVQKIGPHKRSIFSLEVFKFFTRAEKEALIVEFRSAL